MDAQYNGSNAINTLAAFLRCLSHVAGVCTGVSVNCQVALGGCQEMM